MRSDVRFRFVSKPLIALLVFVVSYRLMLSETLCPMLCFLKKYISFQSVLWACGTPQSSCLDCQQRDAMRKQYG